MSLRQTRLAKRVRGVSPAERCLLFVLADYANDEGVCWPSLTTLSDDLEVHRTTVCSLLKNLKSKGLVRRNERVLELELDGKGSSADTTKGSAGATSGSSADTTGVVAPTLPGSSADATRLVALTLPPSEPVIEPTTEPVTERARAPREASVVDEAPVSLENAISRGEEMAIVRGVVEQWWHARNAVGWVRGVGGRRVTGWESDLVTFKNAYNENTHSKNGNSRTKPDVDIYADGF